LWWKKTSKNSREHDWIRKYWFWSKYPRQAPLESRLVLQIHNVVKLAKAERQKSRLSLIPLAFSSAERQKSRLSAILLAFFGRWALARWHVEKWVFKLVSREGLVIPHFFHNRETLLGAWRASWRLLGVLGNSPTPPWVFSSIHGGFSPFWGWRGRWVTNWRCWCEGEAQLEHGAAAKNLGRGLHLLFGFHLFPISLICKT